MQIELRSIDKSFGPVKANEGIDLRIDGGSIQGILGENGAGKSTLMKILSGFMRPDRGSILIDGRTVTIRHPRDALRLGIGMLHQDPLDFPTLSVLDDYILGSPCGFLPDRRRLAAEFRTKAASLGFALDPEATVGSLTVGERQQLEILRLLHLGARSLILDEPTTGISQPQKERLFATLRMLAKDGMSIVFVSHKLEDIGSLCDRAAILRQGRLAGCIERPFGTADLVRLMFGKDLPHDEKPGSVPGRALLSVQGLGLDTMRLRMRGIGLELPAGGIIGLAGMEGSGQSLLLQACAGLVQPTAGSICIHTEDHEHRMRGRGHHAYRNRGVAWIPASRMEEGLVSGMTILEHSIVAEGSPSFFIQKERHLRQTETLIAEYRIKGAPDDPVESLSGGNQQRTLLALLKKELKIILIEHPTRGLDIESSAYIWSRLRERCTLGQAIIFISSDLDEILRYSDRVMVFFSGKVSPPLPAKDLSVERLGRLIGGADWDSGILGEVAHGSNS